MLTWTAMERSNIIIINPVFIPKLWWHKIISVREQLLLISYNGKLCVQHDNTWRISIILLHYWIKIMHCNCYEVELCSINLFCFSFAVVVIIEKVYYQDVRCVAKVRNQICFWNNFSPTGRNNTINRSKIIYSRDFLDVLVSVKFCI